MCEYATPNNKQEFNNKSQTIRYEATSMRYFRYKNTDKNVSNALEEQYKTLTEDEKRTIRKEKRWRRFSTLVTFIVFIFCATGGIFLLKSIPLPNFWLLETLVILGKLIVSTFELL